MSFAHVLWANEADLSGPGLVSQRNNAAPRRAVLLHLAIRIGHNAFAFPTIADICGNTHLSPSAVKYALRDLKAGKLIDYEQQPNGANRYYLLMPAERLSMSAPADSLTDAQGGLQETGGGLQVTTEIEIETEKERKRAASATDQQEAKTKTGKFDPHTLPLPACLTLPLWAEWLKHLREKRVSCTPSTMLGQLRDIDELNAQGHPPEEVIRRCIKRGLRYPCAPLTNARAAPTAEPVRQARRVIT